MLNKVTKKTKLVIGYNAVERIVAFIGLSDITTHRKYPHTMYSISKVVLHYGFQPNNPSYLANDIALLQLKITVRFETYINTFNTHVKIYPICLP